MKKNRIEFVYTEHESPQTLEAPYIKLVSAAKEASGDAYAPYSNFNVGAAVLLEDGTIVKGSNQENASFPLCICAEANVLSNYGSNFKEIPIVALAVSVQGKEQIKDKPISPCGACRQIISEYQNRQQKEIHILLSSESGRTFEIQNIFNILPLSFGHQDL
ncbi:MAG: cytidine deaminase [Saprospiraceae bacterium]|jgi:cytidine deaminase|nr:cytidine deaminase [Saprospiraceae bacterium]MBL0294980.1 cytidine deaminase [Saprospiraceae bacterium]